MTLKLTGVIHGRHVELERETGLPEGARVVVRIDTRPMSLTERRQRMRGLCGAWKCDESLDAIFAAIERERLRRPPREIDFDDPS